MRLRRVDPDLNRAWIKDHYGESLVIGWGEKILAISAGLSDEVHVFRDLDDPGAVYVLSRNTRLGYVGVDEFRVDQDRPHPYDDRFQEVAVGWFTQTPEEVKPEGTPLLEMAPHSVVRWLMEPF